MKIWWILFEKNWLKFVSRKLTNLGSRKSDNFLWLKSWPNWCFLKIDEFLFFVFLQSWPFLFKKNWRNFVRKSWHFSFYKKFDQIEISQKLTNFDFNQVDKFCFKKIRKFFSKYLRKFSLENLKIFIWKIDHKKLFKRWVTDD